MTDTHIIHFSNQSQQEIISRLTWELGRANNEILELKSKLNHAESEIELIWKTKVNNLTQKVDKLSLNIYILERENLDLKKGNKEIRDLYENSKKEIEYLKQEVNLLKTELHEKNIVNEKLLFRVDTLEKETVDLKTELHEKNTENKKLLCRVDTLEKEIVYLKEEIHEKNTENKKLLCRIDTLEKVAVNLKAEIANLKIDNKTLQQEIVDLRKEMYINKLNIKVAEIVKLFQWIFILKNTEIESDDIDIKYISKCKKSLLSFEKQINSNTKSNVIFKSFKRNRNEDCHDIDDINATECKQLLLQYCKENNLNEDHVLYANAMIEYISTNLSSEHPFSSRQEMIWQN